MPLPPKKIRKLLVGEEDNRGWKQPQRVDFTVVFRPTPAVPNPSLVSKVTPTKQYLDLGGVLPKFDAAVARKN